MDMDVSSLKQPGEASREGPSVSSGGIPSKSETRADQEEVIKRQERQRKRGAKLKNVLGLGAKYVVDLGEYKKKKVRVYVQYEGYGINSVPASQRLRVAITIPPKWIDEKVERLKKTFLEAYKRDLGPTLLAAADTSSYITFAKVMIPDDSLIGELHENQELFVVTEDDVARLDAEISKLEKALLDYEDLARQHATVDVSNMAVVSQIDPEKRHALLIGMGALYMLPVEPQYTIADLKFFIASKTLFPLGSLDLASIDDFEINVLSDDLTMDSLAKQIYGDEASDLPVPVFWGKRLQDPKYFIWIPTLHTPDSFRGSVEQDQQQQQPQDMAKAAVANPSSYGKGWG